MLTWIHYALSAAALWGINYSVGERLIRSAGVPALLLANTVGGGAAMLGYLVYTGSIIPTLTRVTRDDAIKMVICGLFSACAIICAQMAISHKNATLAGLVEMTYPVFTALFAYLLFQDMPLTPAGALGGALILLGLSIIARG